MILIFMSPQPKVADIIFGADPVGVRVRVASFQHLLNPWMDFDQTCIDTWLGLGKELIRF